LIIFLSNALFIVYWTINFLHELRITLRRINPILFYMICTCCQKKKYEKEMLVESHLTNHEKFVADLEQAVQCKFRLLSASSC